VSVQPAKITMTKLAGLMEWLSLRDAAHAKNSGTIGGG
jgi:hypothetical protein